MDLINNFEFKIEDQIRFSILSGDYNPMHIDLLKSRRYIFGRPIVHGVNLVLWSLDHWAKINNSHFNIKSIKCAFPNPVFLDENVEINLHKDSGKSISLNINSYNKTCVKISFNFSDRIFNSLQPIDEIPKKKRPKNLDSTNISDSKGILKKKNFLIKKKNFQ